MAWSQRTSGRTGTQNVIHTASAVRTQHAIHRIERRVRSSAPRSPSWSALAGSPRSRALSSAWQWTLCKSRPAAASCSGCTAWPWA
eukprot:3611624-Prymnesium_polylepis.1